MIKRIDKRLNLVLGYQCILAVGAVFIFFTNLDTYLEVAVAGPSPKLWIIAFAFASLPLLLSSFSSTIKYFSKPLLIWLTSYIVISIIYLGLGTTYQKSFEELKSRVLAVFFMLLMTLIFSRYSLVHLWARRTILFVTLINIITYFYGLVNPSAFVTVVEHQSAELTGRPSGFYVDANRAGCALVIGMILTIDLLPIMYRVPFIFIVFIGTLVTFSRSAPLTFLVVLLILYFKNKMPRRHLYIWGIGLTISLIAANLLGFNLLDPAQLQYSDLLNSNAINRIEQFESLLFNNTNNVSDSSSEARLDILKFSWYSFLERPFLGWGIGYALESELIYNIRPHNMYLLYMLDHGVLGAFFLPLLILAITQNASKEDKTMSLAFATLIILWGVFSHNILELRDYLLTFSLIGAINTKSQLEHNEKVMEKI